MSDYQTHLTDVLATHVGRGNGITAEALARHVGVVPREVRRLISLLRAEGMAICGHPSTGYYIAATQEDVEETCQFLRSRALHSLRLEARLRQLSLPDLLGQIRFNQ